jgi:hypothetical protein
MRTSRAASALFVIALTGTARATPNFPPAIQQHLSLAAEPHCAICHSDGDKGGLGTVTTPFGKNMRQRGLVPFDTNALKNALDEMSSRHVNSAGDCLDDIDELKAGRDPNVADPSCLDGGGGRITPTEGDGPSYGCAVARPRRTREVPIVVFFAATILLLRRSRFRG